ncbi:MAG: LPS export ABC transporter periplasmic protein LptC [Armatimonadetes bacterium]|nr:LPS export ABC transporter periplasmic protein LptC [Armatimonadota bacterium]
MVAIVGLGGCGKGRRAASAKASESPFPRQDVTVQSGSFTARNEKSATREVQYTVHWTEADLEIDPSKKGGMAKVRGITGELFEDGKVSATFAASEGVLNQLEKTMKVKGQVKVTSKATPDTLTCEEMDYAAKDEIIKARGKVYWTGPNGKVGPMDELWASRDLKRVATPNLFQGVR